MDGQHIVLQIKWVQFKKCYEFTFARKVTVGLKAMTRRGGMVTASPVLGLRAGRDDLARTSKLPNPETLTSSPWASFASMVSKNASTKSLASLLLRPSCSNSKADNSALVKVGEPMELIEISILKLSMPRPFVHSLSFPRKAFWKRH